MTRRTKRAVFAALALALAAGVGVGVANTVEAMKAECDYVTAADCNHSAVAEALRKFVLDV